MLDTLNGLLAFVVPGTDAYSVAQGVSTPDAGGVEAEVTEILAQTIDRSAPYLPSFSALVAGILNDLALAVGAPPGGPFVSPFARLSFAQKAAAFQIMDVTDALKALGLCCPPSWPTWRIPKRACSTQRHVASRPGPWDGRSRATPGSQREGPS